jgi:hypothetical protein
MSGILLDYRDLPLDLRHLLIERVMLGESGFFKNALIAFRLDEVGSVINFLLFYEVNLFFSEPLNSFPILPEAKLLLTLLGDKVSADTMLLSFEPKAFVTSAISPCINSETMLLVILVAALILPAIVPHISAISLHIVIFPLTFELSSIEP